MSEQKSLRLDSLTGLRFFAALAVLLNHTPRILGPLILSRWSEFGYVGVPFFFALSGFVLTWTAQPTDTARAFWRRRAARVYPLYLVCLIPGVVLAAVGQVHVTVISVILSVLLIQAWFPTSWSISNSPNGPGWSVTAEAFFYAIHPALCARVLRAGRQTLWQSLGGLLALFAGGLVLAAQVFPHAPPLNFDIPYYTPAYQVISFLAGMIICALVRSGARFPLLRVSCGALILVVAILGSIPDHLATELQLFNAPDVELIVLPFMLMIIGSAAQGDLAGRRSVFAHHRLVVLGIWSYALYLVQDPMFMVTRMISPSGFSSNLWISTGESVLFVTLAIGLSGLLHKVIEAPLNARLRGAPPSVITLQEAGASSQTTDTSHRPAPR